MACRSPWLLSLPLLRLRNDASGWGGALLSVISYRRPHDNYFVDGYRFTTMMGECRLYFARDIETPQDRKSAGLCCAI